MKRKIIHLKETDSTSSRLSDYQPPEDEEMTVVRADYQTAGRGNGANTWESEPGKNLLFSVMVHPKHVPVQRQFLLSEAEALAVKEVLDRYADGFTLKWPNDIYWNDRKISGTIIETRIGKEGVKRCIYGTGINVNQREFHGDAPNPVSLCQITGHELDLDHLFEQMLDAIEKYLGMLRENRFQDITALYHDALYRARGFHRFRDRMGEFEGSIVEVEDDGRLILRDRQCHLRSYAFKEVEFLLEKENNNILKL
ncbi:biotin--[acetyl-CoA-carboxylase] ligase [Prevotella sp. oral taxon 376]|uniref:biotin--[acetyl-CoA-carboxylase] ligase n=1 Tax=Prevotella sp. oral taxon 376 TaxID=712466 RepID=UPI000D1E93F2|nr:biotin--[acetyl-CoA-carboxylase] ligase [Prevotella sp. oral taxon 376]PTL33292.1 biotin--[acetyl-CoA-carboxylase] ligase [Prevotella sp. oral taxon 376]